MRAFIAKNFIYRPLQRIRGEKVIRYLKAYEASQWDDPDLIKQGQWAKMKELLEYITEYVPYYKRKMNEYCLKPEDVKTIDDWKKLPTLTKVGLQENFNDLTSTQHFWGVSKKTTGGSTGEPVTILKTPEAQARARAAMYRGFRWFGVDIGDKQARFWGVPLQRYARIRYKIIDLLMNRRRFSAFRFTEKDLESYIKDLKKFDPTYFYGYVSMLAEFASYIKKNDCDLLKEIGLKHIVTTAEVLNENERKLLNDVFCCSIQNEYGCGEVGPIAYECPNQSMHISSENLYVEFIENEQFRDVYSIVITELNNFVMPLIRYEIEDFSAGFGSQCSCGRGLPVMKRIIGRAYDFVVLADGSKFHGEQIMYMFEDLKKEGSRITQFQVVQEELKEFIIRLVIHKNSNFTEISESVRQKFEHYFKGCRIRIEFVETINREKSGKIRVVKNSFLQNVLPS